MIYWTRLVELFHIFYIYMRGKTHSYFYQDDLSSIGKLLWIFSFSIYIFQNHNLLPEESLFLSYLIFYQIGAKCFKDIVFPILKEDSKRGWKDCTPERFCILLAAERHFKVCFSKHKLLWLLCSWYLRFHEQNSFDYEENICGFNLFDKFDNKNYLTL